MVGTFESETLTIDDDANAATITGAITGQSGEALATSSLAESIDYVSGGVESYPDTSIGIIGVLAEFKVRYKTNKGDPYHQ